MKNTTTAYILHFTLGASFAYEGRWLLQFLYWFTFCGFGIGYVIRIFTISKSIRAYNLAYQTNLMYKNK